MLLWSALHFIRKLRTTSWLFKVFPSCTRIHFIHHNCFFFSMQSVTIQLYFLTASKIWNFSLQLQGSHSHHFNSSSIHCKVPISIWIKTSLPKLFTYFNSSSASNTDCPIVKNINWTLLKISSKEHNVISLCPQTQIYIS